MRKFIVVSALALSGCYYYTEPDTAALSAQDSTLAERVLLTCDQFLDRGTAPYSMCVMRGIDQYTGETRYRQVPAREPGRYKQFGPFCYHNGSPFACSSMPGY